VRIDSGLFRTVSFPNFENQYAYIAKKDLAAYEGGNHFWDVYPDDDVERLSALRDWLFDSDASYQWHKEYYRLLRKNGVKVFCHYSAHTGGKETAVPDRFFGASTQRGRRDESPYRALKEYALTGAPNVDIENL